MGLGEEGDWGRDGQDSLGRRRHRMVFTVYLAPTTSNRFFLRRHNEKGPLFSCYFLSVLLPFSYSLCPKDDRPKSVVLGLSPTLCSYDPTSTTLCSLRLQSGSPHPLPSHIPSSPTPPLLLFWSSPHPLPPTSRRPLHHPCSSSPPLSTMARGPGRELPPR